MSKSARHRCLFSVSPPLHVLLAGGYISGEVRCTSDDDDDEAEAGDGGL